MEAQELNREVCMETFAAVAALGNRQIFILGDWNFEPDNFPIDLLHGGQYYVKRSFQPAARRQTLGPNRIMSLFAWISGSNWSPKRKLLDTGACTFFEWPAFRGEIPPTAEAQLTRLDAWVTSRKKELQAERTASWRAYVKEMWATRPMKIYKWIRGTAAVWDLAILSDTGFALTPDQAAQAELAAWSKLWQPGCTTFTNKTSLQSSWRTGDLQAVINHCPLGIVGKARGVDRWSIAELRLLPDLAIEDLAKFLKVVETQGAWPVAIKEMLYLQLPKEGARGKASYRPPPTGLPTL
eukprot:5963890-Amphidinium_carterae.1